MKPNVPILNGCDCLRRMYRVPKEAHRFLVEK